MYQVGLVFPSSGDWPRVGERSGGGVHWRGQGAPARAAAGPERPLSLHSGNVKVAKAMPPGRPLFSQTSNGKNGILSLFI